VSIDAGRDILSFIPTVGAFGPGNVTLTAGQRILGQFSGASRHRSNQCRSGRGIECQSGDLEI